jgi:hypothetical protein
VNRIDDFKLTGDEPTQKVLFLIIYIANILRTKEALFFTLFHDGRVKTVDLPA